LKIKLGKIEIGKTFFFYLP